LWDWLPLSDTYAQLQEIRTYYKFHDLDVDRYWLDGSYQSVMLSARELRPSLLPPNAQTWVNRHVLFTHGNGAVMSPVTRKSTEGLPFFYLRDIPPVADGGPQIREPRIYYGEEPDSYVIVKGSTPEFDYPKGKDNVYAAYDGAGGIPIGAMVWQGLFAYYFNDPNLVLSSYITADSRIMIRRNIRERVRTIAPFLRLDRDPYLVISNGRMFWIQDAYTTSSYFPASQPALVTIRRDGATRDAVAQATKMGFVFVLDRETGALRSIDGGSPRTGTHPRAVTIHPSGTFVYSANWDSSDLSGFRIDPTAGSVAEIPGSPFPAGARPMKSQNWPAWW